MNKLFLVTFFLITLASCCNKYKINGESTLIRLDGKKLFLKILDEGEMVAIDSAEVVHGAFAMKGDLDSVTLGVLYMGDVGIMPLVLERGLIKIQLDNAGITAKGTQLNDKLYTFFNQKTSLEEQLEELVRSEARRIMDGENADAIRRELSKEEDKLIGKINDLIKGFITENYENILGPGVFAMVNASYSAMPPLLENIINEAPESFKNHYLIKSLPAVRTRKSPK